MPRILLTQARAVVACTFTERAVDCVSNGVLIHGATGKTAPFSLLIQIQRIAIRIETAAAEFSLVISCPCEIVDLARERNTTYELRTGSVFLQENVARYGYNDNIVRTLQHP